MEVDVMVTKTMVIDNYAAPGDDASSGGPSFETRDEAVAWCKRIVDGFLQDNHKPGMSATELWKQYTMFGEDPCLLDNGNAKEGFSGWDYARERCEVLCGERITHKDPNDTSREAGYVISADWTGTWGWIYRPEREAFLGTGIAESTYWGGERPISRELRDDFLSWQQVIADTPFFHVELASPDRDRFGDFSWRVFHAQGLQLASRLKQELGAEYVVIYSRPEDDESSGIGWRNLVVRMDGSTAEYVHKPYWAAGDGSAR
jgi:hypothetical protein